MGDGDRFWNEVVFLSSFEGGTVTDESQLAQTVTLTGTTAASATQAKFGTQSLSHPVFSAGGATVPNNASFALGTGHFTIETFVYFTANLTLAGSVHYLISQYDDGTGYPANAAWNLYYMFNPTGFLGFHLQDSVSGERDVGAAWTPSLNTWYHIAVDYDGTNYRIYVNGVMNSKDTASYNIITSAAPLCLASYTTNNTPNTGTGNRFVGFLDETRVTVGAARYASDAGFTPPSTEFDAFAWSGLVTAADTINVAPSNASLLHANGNIADGIGVSAFIANVYQQLAAASDAINVSPSLVVSYGQVVVERLRIALSQVPNVHQQFTLSDTIALVERTIIGIPQTVVETIGIAVDQLAQDLVTLAETLGVQSVLTPTFMYNRSVTETLRLVDALARFFGADAVETIGISEVLAGTGSYPATLAEGVGVAETASPQMVLRVVASDAIDVSATEALNMIFNPELTDQVELSAAYLSPGGGILTWAMNTRTGAVTEYQNYAFNSFAKLGNKYVGASSSGLYELLGDDDDGTSIVATIRSGFAQWSGTHLGSFKAAYLAARGAGQFVLRVITGDGKTYNYTVTAESMKTTKVNMGKGLRARYFAFELVSAGQDFDLDTLEFIPLVADRRI